MGLEEKAVEVVDRVTGAAEQLVNKLAEFAPQVTDVVLLAARISAGQRIFSGLVLAAACYAAYRAFKFSHAKYSDRKEWDRDLEGFGCIASGIICFGTGIGSFALLMNLWAWAGLFRPEVWIAYKLLNI